jgi:hypothetical protein
MECRSMKIATGLVALFGLLLVTEPAPALAQASRNGEPSPTKRTFTYKVVGDVKIEADVYQPNNAVN